MPETHVQRVHTEPAVLDIGGDVGALMLVTPPELVGVEIEVSLVTPGARRVHTQIHERSFAGQKMFAGVYPELPAGEYYLWRDGPQPAGTVRIVGGEVATIDWR